MLSLEELNQHHLPTTLEMKANLSTLLTRINGFREAFGIPMMVTSGLRSKEEQEALIQAGKSNAFHSMHLIGAAVDIFDPESKVYEFARAREDLLEELKLWCEVRRGDWQHFQIYPPKSGRRWFEP